MGIKLYCTPLAAGIPKRQAERQEAMQLAREAGLGPIQHDTNGAPYVETPGVFISISHDRHICVLAVSDVPVGVDAESPSDKLLSVIGRVSSPAEASLDALHLWTAKEAVFKCAATPGMVISEVTVSPTLRTAEARGRLYNLRYKKNGDTLICTAVENVS